MILTTEKAVTVFHILNAARLGEKMADNAKFAVIHIVRQLKPVASSWQDLIKDATERLCPDNFDSIALKIQKQIPLTPKEQAIASEYDAKIKKCIDEEARNEVEIKVDSLSEEDLNGLIASNSFSVSEIMTLYDTIVQ